MSESKQRENLLTFVQSQFDTSREWRQDVDREELWERMVNLYRGRHYTEQSSEHRMVVNMAFPTKNVVAPSVAINNPKFNVGARKPEHAAQAIVTETVINYIWRTFKYQAEFRLAVDDQLVMGHGWIKVGYKATKPPEVKKVPDEGNDATEPEREGVDDREDTEGNVESEMFVSWDEDRPFVERVSPFDMFVDPYARHPKEMRWIAQRVRRHVNDVKVDSRYNEKARMAAAAKSGSAFDGSEVGRPDTDDIEPFDANYCDVIEYYDLRRQTVCTFLADGAQDRGFLIDPQPMPYAFGHPFVMLRNYEVPDYFYPMGELEAIEILQKELNETRSQMLTHRQKYARKYLIHQDSFDEEGMKALQSDIDNEMVPFDGELADMKDSVVAMPVQGTPPDFYNQTELIQSDIDRVSGVSDYMRGTQASIRRTATEAAMIQDAQNARASDKLSGVETALAEIGSKLIMLMQQYMQGEHVVKIVGVSAPTWVAFDVDYIRGQFDFEVEAGSTQPRNESFRQQHALQLVDAMSMFQGIVNPTMLAQYVLRAFGIKDPESYITGGMGMPGEEGMPPEDPMAAEQGGPPQMMKNPTEIPGMEGAAPEEMQSIEGIPEELFNQLSSASGLQPRGV